MNAKTLTALNGAIAKWEGIINGSGVAEHGREDCPLCKLFNDQAGGDDGCKGCPVAGDGKHQYCHDTPYWDWYAHHNRRNHDNCVRFIRCKRCRSLAIKELDFLKSLLPKAKTTRMRRKHV
jgi:hypothetical protein